MIEITPNYYKKFKCIADKCKHNCCIGWEIDIDEETLDIYQSLEGKLGEKIRENISEEGCFILGEGDRCPFLNKNGLCDIITELGEDGLCDICALHPRFNNCYLNFMETGPGLSCEEAARIILSEEKFSIDVPENPPEKEFFKEREIIFKALQNRNKSLKERFAELFERYRFEIKTDGIKEFYLSLERLDEKWTEMLCSAGDFEDFPTDFEKEFEQLAVYFVFRHMHKALDDKDYGKWIGFSYISCVLISCLFKEKNFENLLEISRMYSSEIEYCEENTEKIINYIRRKP